MTLGLIGYGQVGTAVAKAIAGGRLENVTCPVALVRRARAEGADAGPRLTTDPQVFLAEEVDAVLECAGHDAVRQHGEAILRRGTDLIVVSTGAFTDDALFRRLADAARSSGSRLVMPSMAIGAIDMLSSAALDGLDEVRMEVREPPSAWAGTKAKESCDLVRIRQAQVIYDGPARQAALDYPDKFNIAATLALAGCGLDDTQVILIADPRITTPALTIDARGFFGHFRYTQEMLPTGHPGGGWRIVALAAIKTIERLRAPVLIGG